MPDLYGPAVTAAISALRAEPQLYRICGMMRAGILAHPWVQHEAVAGYLGTVRPPKRSGAAWKLLEAAGKHMAAEQRQLRVRHGAVGSTEKFGNLPPVAQQCYHVLCARGQDRKDGGPSVLASVRVLAAAVEETYGRRYSLRAISFGVRKLEEAGFIGITHGVAYGTGERPRSSVYHLLRGYFTSPVPGSGARACEVGMTSEFLARLQTAFREGIELVRRFKYARRQESREGIYRVRWEDFLPHRAAAL